MATPATQVLVLSYGAVGVDEDEHAFIVPLASGYPPTWHTNFVSLHPAVWHPNATTRWLANASSAKRATIFIFPGNTNANTTRHRSVAASSERARAGRCRSRLKERRATLAPWSHTPSFTGQLDSTYGFRGGQRGRFKRRGRRRVLGGRQATLESSKAQARLSPRLRLPGCRNVNRSRSRGGVRAAVTTDSTGTS